MKFGRKFSFYVLLCLAAGMGEMAGRAPAARAEAAVEDRAVALVDGQAIMESDVHLADREIGGCLGTLPAGKRKRALIEFLLETQLLANAAEKTFPSLKRETETSGRTNYWRRRALRELYFNEKIRKTVTEADAEAVYAEERETFSPHDEISARHILSLTEEQAKDALLKIARGADFAVLAREISQDPATRDVGGYLGTFVKGQMIPEIEETAFGLRKGEISPPVHSHLGWHVIRVEDRRSRHSPPFAEAKKRIVNMLIYRKTREISQALRAQARIEYLDPIVKADVEEQARREALASKPPPQAGGQTSEGQPTVAR